MNGRFGAAQAFRFLCSLSTLPRKDHLEVFARAHHWLLHMLLEGTKTVTAQAPRSCLVRSWSPKVSETFDA